MNGYDEATDLNEVFLLFDEVFHFLFEGTLLGVIMPSARHTQFCWTLEIKPASSLPNP